jgi:hypothetical protein
MDNLTAQACYNPKSILIHDLGVGKNIKPIYFHP